MAQALAGLVFLAGCGDEKKTKEAADAGATDAGAKPALGGKLGEALREVASANASPSSSTEAGGPPPTGIFAPGEADKAIGASAPPKLEVLDDGIEPRVTIVPVTPTADEKIPFVLVLGLGGKSILPPLAIELVVGPEGAKKDAKDKAGEKAGDKAKPAASASAAPVEGPPRISATFANVSLAQGGDRTPKELADAVAKLKGSSVSFVLTKTGPVDIQRHLAKDAEKQLDLHLRAISEALGSLYVPAPNKPVGKGAYWMVTDRTESLGIAVVRYRVFKVTDVQGDTLSIAVDVKQYAVNDKIDLPELGSQLEGMTLGRYVTQGKGMLDLAPGHLFAGAASFQVAEQLGFGPQGKQALPVQIAAQIGTTPPRGLVEQQQQQQQQQQGGPGGGPDEP